ncbi:MAG: hypothetical protein M1269_05660 [Chloroflexi bacterium]|nr:hypothetical protein [Chloroflexota bacterium]
MSFMDGLEDKIRKGADKIIRKGETALRIERLKMDVTELKKKREDLFAAIGRHVYDLYAKDMIVPDEVREKCHEIKIFQSQLDEKWMEINQMKKEGV